MAEGDQTYGPLTLNRDQHLVAGGVLTVLGMALGLKAGSGLRRRRKYRQDKYFGRVGSLRLTVKVKTPKLKYSERS